MRKQTLVNSPFVLLPRWMPSWVFCPISRARCCDVGTSMQVRPRASFGGGRRSLLPNSRSGRRTGNVSITMTPAESSKGTATKHQHRAAASNPRRTSVKSLAFWARPVLGIEASRNSAAEAPPVVNARRRRRSRHNFEAFSTIQPRRCTSGARLDG